MSGNHRQTKRQLRILDVAKVAGVSPMTVSRALSRPELVAESTRIRVEEAVKSIGYLPNRLAGALSSRRSNVACLIVPNLDNPIAASTVHGAASVLEPRGIYLMIGEYGSSIDREKELIRAFVAYRPCGLLLQSTVHADGVKEIIDSVGLPVVETGNLIKDPLDGIVSFSNYRAAKAMTEYLVSRYKTVAYIGFSSIDNDRMRDRKRGYLSVVRRDRGAVDPDCVVEVAVGESTGGELLAGMLARRPDIDAVFFAANVLAVDALVECYRSGHAVPGRVAIAGFDDSGLSEKLPPGLTTIRIPREEIGRLSAAWLLERLDGRGVDAPRIDVGFELVRRGSA